MAPAGSMDHQDLQILPGNDHKIGSDCHRSTADREAPCETDENLQDHKMMLTWPATDMPNDRIFMPKSRDIQGRIPLPQAIWNEFWLRYRERSEQYREILVFVI